ncbi:mannose-1-phosphate guanylyltransferase [Demequina capsici]|uniref:Sugar phosphate nucleotidyltransferase n=1 Tax=Demequina capsici TaxID=3075620 RepID=A0AA96F6T0_9MICO|nr:sugar phosphate nucleotidyltransferase [Demequina sp. OYTSA14]WNM25131.1 sugar phosphate nucleotidyltransferase [Demequina sp. OYTSA14]
MTQATPRSRAIGDLVAIVPAGGVGSRLWPLSQPHRPKFLLDLLGTGSTLIQDTVTRLSELTDEVYIVTGARHADAVAEQVPTVPAERLIAEPSPRDSMAAIALAAAVVEHRRGPSVVGSFAADHVITEAEAFAEAVATAVEAARTGMIVTIGIEPTEPSSAFGYIRQGEPLAGVEGALQVVAFTEKPDAATAQTMLADGGYVWNAGMFVVRTDVLLGHLERLQPAIAAGARALAAAWDGPDRAEALERIWPTLTRIAIDHAIAEPVALEGGVAVVPASLGWHDIGDYDSLASMLTPSDDGVIAIGCAAPVGLVRSTGALVVGGTRPVAIVGLDDAVVVETDEALLVTTRQAAQAVKDAGAAVARD